MAGNRAVDVGAVLTFVGSGSELEPLQFHGVSRVGSSMARGESPVVLPRGHSHLLHCSVKEGRKQGRKEGRRKVTQLWTRPRPPSHQREVGRYPGRPAKPPPLSPEVGDEAELFSVVLIAHPWWLLHPVSGVSEASSGHKRRR